MGESIFESLPKEKISRKKFMKLCAFGIGTLAINSMLLSSLSSTAYAHPPSDIKITYDSKTKILTALIMHNVSDVKKHYINKVDVGLNGREVISQAISQQDNNINQRVSYLIPDAKAGDILSVEAYCNISGKLEKEIEVSK
jgi:desulfoferrodoxin (superoxide reductase-like protein)